MLLAIVIVAAVAAIIVAARNANPSSRSRRGGMKPYSGIRIGRGGMRAFYGISGPTPFGRAGISLKSGRPWMVIRPRRRRH